MRALILTLSLLSAACADVQAERMEQAKYCEMVSNGSWPDYENNYLEICK